MGSMQNSKQLLHILEALTKELGREPYSTELLAAVNGLWKPKKEE